jgi:hypothetical protein
MLFASVTPAETDPFDVIDIAAVYPAELYEIAATLAASAADCSLALMRVAVE